MRRWIVILAVALAALCAIGISPGCADQEANLALRQDLERGRAEILAERERTQADVAAARQAGDLEAERLAEARLGQFDELERKLETGFALFEKLVAPDGTLREEAPAVAAHELGKFLPGPWGVGGLVLWGVGVGATYLVQQHRLGRFRQAATSIINGIDALRAVDGSVAAAMKTHKAVLTDQYSPLAVELVRKESIT
jgi:hypothetical protein